MATTKITNPELFDLGSLNTALQLPSGTTAERPTSPSTGEWRYNTTTNLIEFYDGGDWRELQDEEIPPIPSEHFNTVLYTGNGSTQSITGVGFQPDFVWIKKRDATENHRAYDSSRGVGPGDITLYPSLNFAASQESVNGISSLDSDGFTLTSQNAVNSNGNTFVAWCWKSNGGTTSSNTDGTITSTVQVNKIAGFSILTWTGTGAQGTIGHGLNDTPDFIVSKRLDAANNWSVYHKDLGLSHSTYPNWLYLNADSAEQNSGSSVNHPYYQVPSSTLLYQNTGTSEDTNVNTGQYVSYCFAEKTGYSKFGSYTGTGSTTNRPIINTGFEPAFVMIKNLSNADDWMIHDNKRNPSNPRDRYIRANTSDQEGQFADFGLDFLTNGFQVGPTTNNNWNGSGLTYIYIAFASDPSTAPVLADSFGQDLYTGSGTNRNVSGLGFEPSFLWNKQTDGTFSHLIHTSLFQPDLLITNSTGALITNGSNTATFTDNGFSVQGGANHTSINNSGSNFVYWAWKSNPISTINTDGSNTNVIVAANQAAGFSIIKWTGDGVNNATIGHGLSSTPELLIMKTLSVIDNWRATSTYLANANGYLFFNTSGAETTNLSGDGSITRDGLGATTFTCTAGSSTSNNTNKLNDQYIAYAFKSIDGFSKVGTYSGTGAAGNTVTIGFEPSWIMIKRSDSTGGWLIFDSVRNTSNPRNNRLEANNNQAEQTGSATKFVDFDATSFEPQISDSEINASGGTYLYVAFKENPAQPAIPSGEMAYLVVAGGGSGHRSDNNNGAGGGGAGGLRSSYVRTGGGGTVESNITLTTKTYTITVGAGGADNPTAGGPAISGSDSVLDTITSVGGGGGGGIGLPAEVSTSGGSGGGGGGYNSAAGAAGTANQGFAGGNGSPSTSGTFSERNGGGGGGAGSVGTTGSTSSAGPGGIGVTVPITGTNVGYAGGGSGGNKAGSNIPGTDGGGSGAGTSAIGTAGAANTGGGGGGGGVASYAGKGGGSGIVILRMNTSDYSGFVTGSPIVTTIGSETILKYTGSGAYQHGVIAIPAGEMSFLVIAGGGGGGRGTGGGGGAGGLRTSYGSASGGGSSAESNISLSSGTYTITIGSGGAGGTGTGSGNNGTDGSTTSITGNASISSTGGGGGAKNNSAGNTGGSGGGAGCDLGTDPAGGSGTTSQGFAGGTSTFDSGTPADLRPSSGGGGAAQAGGGTTSSVSGNGGNGLAVSITGTLTTYAGGGGGGNGQGETAGNGGLGGGGNGAAGNATVGTGTTNTGGGGGGGGFQSGVSWYDGGAGGSGIVILRMNTSDYSGTTTGSPTVTTVGSETILTYTGSGTYVHS